jgi:predicted phage terminase large subunit-like protein
MSRIILQALLRSDLNSFIAKAFSTVSPGEPYRPNWHIDSIAEQIEGVHAGRTRRLLINQPPRSLKSISVSVAYVAWAIGHNPARRIIVCSYSGDFAAELHRQFRMVVTAQWYGELFPEVAWAKETNLELITTKGGGRIATSIGGTLTGRGADIIVVDDPLNANEAHSESARKRVIDWFGGTLVSRLNDKQVGAIIVVMQRLHEEDLAGHLLGQGGWYHLDLPAIAEEDQAIALTSGRTHFRGRGDVLHPARENLQTLERIKSEIGSLLFSAQYQQRPVPIEGNLIKRAWFQHYETPPSPTHQTRVVQSWDVAMSTGANNDYSVCTTWLAQGADAFLIDVFRKRLEYPDLRRMVAELATQRGAETILIEEAGPGLSMLQDLRTSFPGNLPRPIGIKPLGSKIDRMVQQSAKIEGRQVHLPKNAPWLADFLQELLSFPNGRHDDQVDSVSQFLFWFQSSFYADVPIVAPIIITGGPRQIPY